MIYCLLLYQLTDQVTMSYFKIILGVAILSDLSLFYSCLNTDLFTSIPTEYRIIILGQNTWQSQTMILGFVIVIYLLFATTVLSVIVFIYSVPFLGKMYYNINLSMVP